MVRAGVPYHAAVNDAASAPRRLPRTFWLLIAGMFVNRIGSFVLPFLSLYLEQEERMGAGAKGAVISSWGVGTVLAGLAGGRLTDRWGRKPTMLLGLCGGATTLLALSVAHGVAAWVPLALVLGTVAELYRPAVAASITDLVGPSERARAFALLTWSYNLGFAVSPLVAGLLIEHAGYRWLFVGDAGTMLLAALLIFLHVPETRPAGMPVESTRAAVRSVEAWLDRRFQPLLATAFLLGLMVVQVPSSLALVMEEDGLGAATFGRILSLNGLLIVLTQPWLVPRLERAGRYRVLPWAAALFALGFALHGFAGTALAHAGALAVWTLGEVALFPLCNACVADRSPDHLRGAYQGAYYMSWASANVAGPALGLSVLERAGAPGWGGLLALIGLATVWSVSRLGGRP